MDLQNSLNRQAFNDTLAAINAVLPAGQYMSPAAVEQTLASLADNVALASLEAECLRVGATVPQSLVNAIQAASAPAQTPAATPAQVAPQPAPPLVDRLRRFVPQSPRSWAFVGIGLVLIVLAVVFATGAVKLPKFDLPNFGSAPVAPAVVRPPAQPKAEPKPWFSTLVDQTKQKTGKPAMFQAPKNLWDIPNHHQLSHTACVIFFDSRHLIAGNGTSSTAGSGNGRDVYISGCSIP